MQKKYAKKVCKKSMQKKKGNIKNNLTYTNVYFFLT